MKIRPGARIVCLSQSHAGACFCIWTTLVGVYSAKGPLWQRHLGSHCICRDWGCIYLKDPRLNRWMGIWPAAAWNKTLMCLASTLSQKKVISAIGLVTDCWFSCDANNCTFEDTWLSGNKTETFNKIMHLNWLRGSNENDKIVVVYLMLSYKDNKQQQILVYEDMTLTIHSPASTIK